MPPFVGVAVNVTLVPAQIVLPGFAAILTEGVTDGVTVIEAGTDVAEPGLAQLSDDVIITYTSSPLTKLLLEYVLLFVPTLLPFNFH